MLLYTEDHWSVLMHKFNILIIMMVITTSSLCAELTSATRAKEVTSVKHQELLFKLRKHPKALLIIKEALKIVNKEIMLQTKKGYPSYVIINFHKKKNSTILARLKKLGTPLNALTRQTILYEIKNKGYEIDLHSDEDDFIFTVKW